MKTYSNLPHHNEHTISLPCTICGETLSALYWELLDYSFVRCKQCGHVYQDPQPDQRALLNRYAQEYFEYERENDRAFLKLMLLGLEDANINARLEKRRPRNMHSTHPHAVLRTTKHTRRLLDIGCATGALLEYYQQRGWEVQGVEVCQEAADWGIKRRGVDIFKGELAEAKLPSSSFDLIHASHVIEHVPYPRKMLAECRRLVDPEGLIVIVTPNRAGLQARLLGARWRSAIADHLNLFDFAHLRRLAQEVGLQVLYKCSWGGWGKGLMLPWLKRPLDFLAKRFNVGDVMLVVFQKV